MKKNLEANSLRRTVIEMAFRGSTVHVACALSIIEILLVIYKSHLNFDFNKPKDPSRDYLVLSKGHGVMAQYACMRALGYLLDDDISNYFKDGTKLKGLADSRVKGLEVSTGSLGHGLSVAAGFAYGAKINKTDQKVFAIVGDGELNEGPCWEAIQFAGHHKLQNLMVIVDKNNFQAMGRTEDVISQDNLHAQIESFGFEVMTMDGHDEKKLDLGIAELFKSEKSKPKSIIANTIKGKGISFMENSNEWHYRRLDNSTYKEALAELELKR